jgi:hypothetical protein
MRSDAFLCRGRKPRPFHYLKIWRSNKEQHLTCIDIEKPPLCWQAPHCSSPGVQCLNQQHLAARRGGSRIQRRRCSCREPWRRQSPRRRWVPGRRPSRLEEAKGGSSGRLAEAAHTAASTTRTLVTLRRRAVRQRIRSTAENIQSRTRSGKHSRPCLVPKIFKNPRHIECLDTCIEH